MSLVSNSEILRDKTSQTKATSLISHIACTPPKRPNGGGGDWCALAVSFVFLYYVHVRCYLFVSKYHPTFCRRETTSWFQSATLIAGKPGIDVVVVTKTSKMIPRLLTCELSLAQTTEKQTDNMDRKNG